MSTLDELLKPLTRAEVETYIYTAIKDRGTKHTAWKPGSFSRTMVTIVAVLISCLSILQVALAKSAFIRHARGVWLTLLAKWVYGVDRDPATFATGSVRLTNTGGGVYNNVAVGALIVSNEGGFKFRNTSAFSLAALGVIDVPVAAVFAGTSSNSGVDEIRKIESPSMNGVMVTNLAALTGLDEQDDDSLVEECLASLGASSSLGPSDAYEFAARNAKLSDGSPANINRAKPLPPDGTGVVSAIVASAAGAPTGSIADLGTELGAAHHAMLTLAAPLCVDVNTIPATAKEFEVRFDLTMPLTDGRALPELQALLDAELLRQRPTIPIGGWDGVVPTLWFSSLIKTVLPTAIRAPLPGDSYLRPNEVAVPTLVIKRLLINAG